MTRDQDIGGFLRNAGHGAARRTRLAGDASGRRYERIHTTDGKTMILMDADPETGEDIRPFLRIRAHLYRYGFSAPAVLADDPSLGLMLMEDFGDAVFARVIAEDPEKERPLYRLAADLLSRLHTKPLPGGMQPMSAGALADMIEPAFSHYAPGFKEVGQTARDQFAAALRPVADVPAVLALRDFHAENMIYLPDRKADRQVGLLDFQDAIATHPAYDLVSMLQDARRDLQPGTEDHVIDHFVHLTGADRGPFLRAYALLGAQRNLRILGIFSRLAALHGKARYLAFQPRVWDHLQRALSHPGLECLQRVLAPLPSPEEARS